MAKTLRRGRGERVSHLAPRAAQRQRAADGIALLGGNRVVDVGRQRTAGVVGRASRALDPPAVLAEHGSRRQAGYDRGTRDERAALRLDADPIALRDAARRRIGRRNLHDRIGNKASQRRNVAMLAVAVGNRLGAAEAQRIARIGGIAAFRRQGGNGWIARQQQPLRIELDLARRRRKAARAAIDIDGMRLERRRSRRPRHQPARRAAAATLSPALPRTASCPLSTSPSNIRSAKPSRFASSTTMSVSDLASPTGAMAACRNCTRRRPSRLTSKPARSPSRSQDVATGSTMSA